MGISFDHPYLLALLVPSCALVVYFWRTSHVYLPSFRRHAALAFRLLTLGLLVMALSGPSLRLNATNLSLVMLLDRSDSITPAERAQEEDLVAQALAHKSPDDQLGVIGFAGTATVERPLSTDVTPPVYSDDSTLDPSRTDIAGAIRLGLGVLPPDAVRRLVLISDGNANSGQADQAAALAHTAGVQLDTIALTSDSGPQALVEALDAPPRLNQGDRFTVTVQVHATQAMPASLSLMADDQLIGSQDVQLAQGENRLILPVDGLQQGAHVLKVLMETDADPRPENKTGGAYVIVDGPPRVLVVEGASGAGSYLVDALKSAGLQVDVSRAPQGPFQSDTLNNYASVVLVNVPADQITSSGTDALKNYVQSHGGGLVVTGGDQTFGPGGYARTPLEDLLPVTSDLRGSSLQASVGLVLAIDTSGSMGQDVGGTTIMDLAKQAALAAAQALGPGDEIGVISLETNSSWAVQPTPASNMDAISAAVDQMAPGGGDDTDANAVFMGDQGLAQVDARSKHIILITDGQNPGGDYASALQQAKAANVSISTIGIGDQADTQLLQQIAQLGGGAYYDGSDPFNLPQLVVKETQQLQRAAIVEQDTQPVEVSSSPVLANLDGAGPQSLPVLRGYVATTPRPQSTVILAAPSADPLLAEWQDGLGTVLVWTSDVSNTWSAPWLQDTNGLFGSFWAQVVKRTIRPPEDPNRQVSVKLSADQATVTLDAVTDAEGTADRQYVNFLPTSVSVVEPGGTSRQAPLPQTAPGEYQASLPAATQGVYTLQVTENDADGSQSTQSSGFVVPYSPEYRDLDTNTTLLDTLASDTGGRGIVRVDDALTHDLPAAGAPRPIWPALLALAMGTLVADIACRRLRLSAFEVRGGYYGVRRRLGYVDHRPTVRKQPASSAPDPARMVGQRAEAPDHVASTSMAQQLLAARRRAERLK
jgi:Mg-chelatase subunit ChlD/uncharacterized membrane protein